MTEFHQYLQKISDFKDLSQEEASRAFQIIMGGGATPGQMAAFLVGLRMKGEKVAEITGGAGVMRAKAEPFAAPAHAIDVCGTGGDAIGTFNVSTAVAIVTAACGVPVAKHGNKSVSSKSGSADVLKALGVHIDARRDTMEQALRDAGLCFMMAPRYHGAMRHVGPVRQELKLRTIFNLLGPLSNPAGTRRQLIGVFGREWVEPIAEVLRNLGTEKAWVVHGLDGMDELTTTAPTYVAELQDGAIRSFTVAPVDAGLAQTTMEALKGGGPEVNARALASVLSGHKEGPARAYREIVMLNTAAALVVADNARDLRDGASMAAEAIDSGRAKAVLAALVEITTSELVEEER